MINSDDPRQIRIIEQWSKEIIDLSLEYAKTADFSCFTLSVYSGAPMVVNHWWSLDPFFREC